MKNTLQVLKSFENAVERYLAELKQLDMEQLHRKTDEEEWSIGQMYMHLIQSALFMHLPNIKQCLVQSEPSVHSNKGKTELGESVFEQGQFPAIRIKVPASPQYTPKSPENMEQLVEGLHQVIAGMREMEAVLRLSPVTDKIIHPSLGALDAQEWFLLIEMHYRHHFLQLDRLKMELGIGQREGEI